MTTVARSCQIQAIGRLAEAQDQLRAAGEWLASVPGSASLVLQVEREQQRVRSLTEKVRAL